MGKNDRCCVGSCDNDKRYPDKLVKRNHVEKLRWHRFTEDPGKRKQWITLISKGRVDFNPGPWTYVCSNHFVDGQPTTQNPLPVLFLSASENRKQSPKKRRHIVYQQIDNKKSKGESDTTEHEAEIVTQSPSMAFEQLTREHDVRFYTGFRSPKIFKTIFEYLYSKASTMTYWDGTRKTLTDSSYATRLDSILSSTDIDQSLLNYSESRHGPTRKLTLEQEFLLVLMKLRLDLMQADLAFRFKISTGKVSQIFITWIKLLSKELSVLIIWPSRQQIKKTLPSCFEKLYPKTRTIIDCTEVFTETPSALDTHCLLWSDYKHHTTIKFLVCITPNGVISWVSPSYGGRASDIHIVRTSGFLNIIEPYDQIMADRGFKIKTDLALHQCSLAIPPSAAAGVQMTKDQTKQTSTIANVRIYVEQAIKCLKDYRILKTELQLLYLPIVDDIIRTCCALNNLKKPLKLA